jgi:D-tyrosyl-tRNA(Tyr) deacylase
MRAVVQRVARARATVGDEEVGAKGRRPSWIQAARPEQAEPLVDAVVAALRDLGATVATGRSRADMAVELVNDGPVTVLLEL